MLWSNFLQQHTIKSCENMYLPLFHFLFFYVSWKSFPKWETFIYCIGFIKTYHNVTWSKLEHHLLRESNIKLLLKNADCVEKNDLILNLLESTTFKPQGKWVELDIETRMKLYHSLVKKYARKPQILNFILKNLDKIVTE